MQIMPRHQKSFVLCKQLYSTALEHHRAGRLPEAAAAYRQALALKPDFLEALCNLGAVMQAMGNTVAAVEIFSNAVELHPDNDRLQYSLGAALQADRQPAAAEEAYRRALDINPDLLEARFNLGMLLMDSCQLEDAALCFAQITENNPHLADAHHHLGIVYFLLGNNHNASSALNRALALRPDHPETLGTLGNVMMSNGSHDHAIELFRKALKLAPGNPKLHFNLGTALKESGKQEAALASFGTALRLEPGLDKAFSEIFRIRQNLCIWETYTQDLEKLLTLNQICLTRGLQSPIYPFDALSLPISAEDQQKIAVSHARECSAKAVSSRLTVTIRPLEDSERLRIGYVSANFNNHAEAHLTASMFRLHDRSRYEVFAYSTGRDDGSTYRQRIREGCEHFIDVLHESDLAIARRIRDDQIHILVDLAVYNKHSATGILALRPAPVQVNYLGFPGTSGADFYDYIITDRVVTPPDQQPWYSEKFAYLPDCYQVNDHELVVPEPDPDRTRHGLPPKGFVFCSFNNAYKIDPGIFDAWMRILERTPGSVLWLLDHGKQTCANLRREAQLRGITGGRLIFAPKLAKEAHLARHRHADLFLDTRYYNAHTTASDALRACVPIVTLKGQTFASRVAASLLEAVGMPQLITTNPVEYIELSIKLATNSTFHKEIRDKLSDNLETTRLFDTPFFVRELEQVYEYMWQSAVSNPVNSHPSP